MTTLELTPLLALRLAGDPALYAASPFLEPMRKAAMSVAVRHGKGCSGCQKASRLRAGKQIASAMTALIVMEGGRTPNQLESLKSISREILNNTFDEILIRYVKEGKQAVFQF
jgi:hypothetical protein